MRKGIIKPRLVALAVTLLLGLPAFGAGPLILGIRGGVPLTDILESEAPRNIHTATKNYVVGPTLGVKLPVGFSVEADALFTQVDVDARLEDTVAWSVKANAWQFPVMLKYKPAKPVSPFIGAGVSVRHLRDFGDARDFLTDSFNGPIVDKNNTVGFVIGGGVSVKAGPVRIEPEIRYTRWGSDNIVEGFHDFLRSNKNDALVLLGLTF